MITYRHGSTLMVMFVIGSYGGCVTDPPETGVVELRGSLEPLTFDCAGVSCDDGVDCTVDACLEGLGCVHTSDSTRCACGETCVSEEGCSELCAVSTCNGRLYECGDCVDNDGDCAVDWQDPSCTGPCDDDEGSLGVHLTGANNGVCKLDCFFDDNTGRGDDDCRWSHRCDPLSSGDPKCAYAPTPECDEQLAAQSAKCLSSCMPLVPNGCDCFGCCEIPGAPTAVYLGSTVGGVASCDMGSLDDPERCAPCTPVPSCFNDCAMCEICVGKPTLPPECFVW
jgi:hypothetical protein